MSRWSEAVELIVDRLDGDAPTQVSFVNADCVNIAFRSPEYRESCSSRTWCSPTASACGWLVRSLGQPVCDNVNGTDLFPRLAAALEGSGKRIYLLGGRAGVAEGVARWLAKNYPGVELAGWRNGYFSAEEEAKVIEDIRRCGADLVLVAFGASRAGAVDPPLPSELGAKVVIGVGGLLDFFSGRVPRAPRWIRKLGMEWCYRLYQEPKRLWRRYVVGNVVFLVRLATDSATWALHSPRRMTWPGRRRYRCRCGSSSRLCRPPPRQRTSRAQCEPAWHRWAVWESRNEDCRR